MSQHGCPERLSNTSIGYTDNNNDDDGASPPTMEVLVETLTGTAFEMTVLPTDTILAIKSKIFRVEGIPVSQQHLLYNSKELDDESSLREHAISEGARLRLVLGMRGGPISTRRLPPPPNAEPWRDIERLLDTNRDDADWDGSGCRVTVLVFRDGERVNMLRVQENHDGTYSPLHPNEYTSASTSLSQLAEREIGGAGCSSRAAGGSGAGAGGSGVGEGGSGAGEGGSGAGKVGSGAGEGGSGAGEVGSGAGEGGSGAGEGGSGAGEGGSGAGEDAGSARDERALQENALTMSKMMELRRRMEMLSVQRARARHHSHAGDTVDIQKTRSEETLSVPSLLDEGSSDAFDRSYAPYSDAEDTFAPLYDGNYTRYDYDCTFTDRYTLLPPIGTRADSDQSVQESVHNDRIKLSDALAGSILVKGRRDTRDDKAAILEECLDSDDCHLRQNSPQLAAKSLAPIPAAKYGPVGSGAHSHSASSLHVRAAAPPRRAAPLADAVLSSSTSDLEKLKRNSRILPALSRHRNRSHLHLSDSGLDVAGREARDGEAGEAGEAREAGEAGAAPRRARGGAAPRRARAGAAPRRARARCQLCRKRLSLATAHSCRCGGSFCALHRYAEEHACTYDYRAAFAAAAAAAAAALRPSPQALHNLRPF